MSGNHNEGEGTPLLQPQESPKQTNHSYRGNVVSPAPPPEAAIQNPMATYATLAAQYEQAGYYPSDAAAAAASVAAFQQQQQQQHYGLYPPQTPIFYGQPSAPGVPGQQPMMQPNPYAMQLQQQQQQQQQQQLYQQQVQQQQQQASLSRPPRASRRVGPKSEEPPPPPSSSSIPPLQDIFSNEAAAGAAAGGGGGGNGNYGSIPTVSASASPIWTSAPVVKVQPVMVRTSSSGDIQKLHSSNRHHRRSSSDIPHHQQQQQQKPPTNHRRIGSMGGGGGGGSIGGIGGSGQRARTFSNGSVGGRSPRPGHRRQASNSSVGSVRSNISVTSNIAKSSMFGGVDATTGRVQMHFPFESVRLVFVDTPTSDDDDDDEDEAKSEDPFLTSSTLKQGHLYMDGKTSDYDQFEDYTMITNAMEDGVLPPQWESVGSGGGNPNGNCGCHCNNCNGCLGKQQLLPDANYLLPVDSRIYAKVVGEIADAQTMPCGLFFCGHHEDVAHPSISIAMVLVTVMFLGMAYVAFVVER